LFYVYFQFHLRKIAQYKERQNRGIISGQDHTLCP
jgi:hypothetical protein